MKLHLGCGQRYLKGYVNIDFPPSEHTVMNDLVADQFADLKSLSYPGESVDEIRLHHVFEHFTRPVAVALVASWASWLRQGTGILHVEVPDFNRTALHALNPFNSRRKKNAALRHLYGSHEAHWGVHAEGWTRSNLCHLLGKFGFGQFQVQHARWKDTFNLEVISRKLSSTDKDSAYQRAEEFLRDFLVDDANSEKKILEIWMKDFEIQLRSTWASS